jgi:3-oxoadipate enol-lactonase
MCRYVHHDQLPVTTTSLPVCGGMSADFAKMATQGGWWFRYCRILPIVLLSAGMIRRCLVVIFIIVCAAFPVEARSGKHKGIYFEAKGKGAPVILIHGGQMDRRMWDFQFDLLAKDYQVIRYDIRGFGKSDIPTRPYSYADDQKALLKHLGLQRASIVGLSLGAAIATDFAVVYPDSVRALVLVCPGLGGFRFEDKANDLRAVTDAAREENYEKVAELWLQNPYMSVAMEHENLRPGLRALSRDNAHCWLNNPLLLRRMTPPAAERLAEIRAPTLVIGGSRDVSDIHKIVAKLSAEIRGAQQQVLKDCGHIAPMENPEAFNRLLVEFLKSQNR